MGLLLISIVPFALSLGFLTAVAKAALGLGFVIFVHELGHFLVAKLCGVKCEKFYVGFDVPIRIGPFQLPRTLFRKQWGETEYGIGIVPLGGYVKMLGQDDNPANSAREAERIRSAQEAGDGTSASEPALDPRSYPAKTVPQRLAIISAGVIMNLIFAVIFGMIAYRMGVSYTPTVVGAASPGLSAWTVGLQTGDRILQMGRDGKPSPHLRFDKDMMVKVMMTGANQDLDLLVQRYQAPGAAAADPEWITVHLTDPLGGRRGRPMIGIGQCGTNVINTNEQLQTLLAHLPANRAEPALAAGDRILAVNGVPVADYRQLTRELAQHVDEPLTLQIERVRTDSQGQASAPETFAATIAPNPVRSVGLVLQIGPLSAIQQGSPGAAAGFQVGDRIVTFQGEPVGDPLALPEKARRLAGQTVQVEVERGGGKVTLSVTPRQPEMLHTGTGPENSVAVESLGIAYPIENRVVSVLPGSQAEAAGLVAGDLLEAAEFVAATPADRALEEQIFGGPGRIERVLNRIRNLLAGEEIYGKPRPIELGEKSLHWPHVQDRLHNSQPSTKLKLSFKRGDRLESAEMLPAEVPGWFHPDRGLNTTVVEEIHRVDSWASSLQLGARETWDGMRQVYFFLFRLVTGRISPLNLGGPASIATMAGMEASQSTPRLLVFLVLLSANLAVVNFLPIPVLDGGHAMFLLYEGIFRKPVNERVAFGLTMLGFCFILGLMLFVIGLDVWRLTGLAG